MPRIGQNPMKWEQEAHHPKRITCATIVHIPYIAGYWENSLDVLKLCLQSMRAGTQILFDLMVFDNRSCDEVQDYLFDQYQAGQIQYLVFSKDNIGKVGAWNHIFAGAPGEIIAYSDSDVYFLDGWLEESVKVLETFSKAGMVTAQPIAGYDMSNKKDMYLAARENPSIEIEEGVLIPDQYLISHLKGVGRYPTAFQERRDIKRNDVCLTKDSISAYLTASHFQFLLTKQVANTLFPLVPELALGDDRKFDKLVMEHGYLRLSTTDYLVHHMGNCIHDFKNELPWVYNDEDFLQVSLELEGEKMDKSVKRIWENRHLRKLLKKLISKIHRILYTAS